MIKLSIIEDAKVSPSEIFKDPADVVAADLPDTRKIEILESWEDEAHQLQAAASEGMTGGEPSRLSEIRRAIDKLKKLGGN